MTRRFYNYICTIYSSSTQVVRGSLSEGKTIKYSDIPCAIWKNTKSYGETGVSYQTDSNQYEMNLYPEHSVSIGDIVECELGTFKVSQAIKHHNSSGILDNWQVFLSMTTNGN